MSSGRPMKKTLVLPYFASDSAGPDFGEVSIRSLSALREYGEHARDAVETQQLCAGARSSNPTLGFLVQTERRKLRTAGSEIAESRDIAILSLVAYHTFSRPLGSRYRIPICSEAICNERAIAPGVVGRVDARFRHAGLEAGAEKQHVLAVRRTLWNTLDAAWLGRQAQVELRFARVPGVARECVELAFCCCESCGRRRESAGTEDGLAIGTPAWIRVAALLHSGRCAVWPAVAHPRA